MRPCGCQALRRSDCSASLSDPFRPCRLCVAPWRVRVTGTLSLVDWLHQPLWKRRKSERLRAICRRPPSVFELQFQLQPQHFILGVCQLSPALVQLESVQMYLAMKNLQINLETLCELPFSRFQQGPDLVIEKLGFVEKRNILGEFFNGGIHGRDLDQLHLHGVAQVFPLLNLTQVTIAEFFEHVKLSFFPAVQFLHFLADAPCLALMRASIAFA